MDNLISVFMAYKVNRLVEYGVLFYQEDTPFIRRVFANYFQTYIDNYYYGVFHTIEENNYNRKNLKLELDGLMEEMLYDYKSMASSEDYHHNCEIIRELKNVAFEIVRFDTLEISNKEDIPVLVENLMKENEYLSGYIDSFLSKIIKLVKETYTKERKLFQEKDSYFELEEKYFVGKDDSCYMELSPSIHSLNMYRKNLVNKVYNGEDFVTPKFLILVQKVSYLLLRNLLEKKEMKKIFIELPDEFVVRGKIDESLLQFIDNPLFQKYVYLGVPYTVYSAHKNAFSVDYHFACIQDFSHINDIYQKVEDIYQDAFSHYLIVSNCRYEDRDYFLEYKNDVLTVLVFEEE